MRKSLGLLALLSVASLALPVFARADDVIARLPARSPIDAYHGRVLWSEPSAAGYRLVLYRHGVIRPLPVAPSSVPFNADLGPDRQGRVVAVYPRCTQKPSVDYGGAPLGCDLYLYDFRRVRETPITRANTKGDDEDYPAIWKGGLVFARPGGFYWVSRTGHRRTRPIGHPPDGFFPSGSDLRGPVAALSFQNTIDSGEVELVRIGGRTRTIPLDPLGGASIGRGYVYWGALGGNRYDGYYQLLVRYDRVAESYDTAYIPALSLADEFTQDGATSYYLTAEKRPCYDANCGPYDLHRLTGLRFGVP